MANDEHLNLLRMGVGTWNRWRDENPTITPDLRRAELNHLKLDSINLAKADLSFADLCASELNNSNLSEADLHAVNFESASLEGVNFNNSKAQYSNFWRAGIGNSTFIDAALYNTDFRETGLENVDFSGANLDFANLAGAYLVGANLTNCRIFGVSAWDVNLENAIQDGLIITPSFPYNFPDECNDVLTVDNIEVAQFIYMMLSNNSFKNIIDTIVSKAVLILGRFTERRKIVLDSIKSELRKKGYVPIIYDFNGPTSRDLSETVSTLAHLSRFVVADITDAKSIPQELQIIVPSLPSLPIQPIICDCENEYGMFEHYNRYPWVLDTIIYSENRESEIINKIISNCELYLKST
ncbi:MAG: hypothetical protein ACI8ZB_001514 [Desulforhopalus sp.]|jgi:hypothetical protein